MTGDEDYPQLRTLLSDLLEVDPPAEHLPTARAVAADYRKRLVTRGVLASASAVVGSAAVLVLAGVTAADNRGVHATPASVATSVAPTPPAVLADGTTVGAAGRVVSVPGHATRLCAPEDNDAVFHVGAQPAPVWCPVGVDVTGVDLSRLTGRRELAGAVEGYAYLRGVYRAGVLTVTTQASPRYPVATNEQWTTPPCPAPARGWPNLRPQSNPQQVQTQVDSYTASHPGQITSTVVFRPSATTAVVVLAAEDPTATREALAAAKNGVCVVQSRYSTAALTSVLHTLEALARTPSSSGIYALGQRSDNSGQPYVQVSAVAVSATLHDLAARAPAGLLRVDPWLVPVAVGAPLPAFPHAVATSATTRDSN